MMSKITELIFRMVENEAENMEKEEKLSFSKRLFVVSKIESRKWKKNQPSKSGLGFDIYPCRYLKHCVTS